MDVGAWWAIKQQMRRRARLAAAEPVEPELPPMPTDYKLWFDANTLDLQIGDSIAVWPDLSGNGNNAAQSTVSSQPTLREVTFAGKTFRVARFDTVDDGMATPLEIPNPTPFSIFVMWRPADLSDIVFCTAVISSGSLDWSMGTFGGGMLCFFTNWTTGGPVNTNDFFLFEVRMTPGQRLTWAYLNGVQTEAWGPGSGSASPELVTLGACGANFYPAACDTPEIIIYDRHLSDLEAAAVRKYFQERYNYLKVV